MASDDFIGETSPLLRRSSSVDTPRRTFRFHGYQNVYVILVIVAGLDFCMYMVNLPLTRVYESIACYQYYLADGSYQYPDPGSIPEALCKVDPVQRELALVRGYESLSMSLPGVLLAFPYGIAADRWGRKPVLLTCILGLALALASVLAVCWFWWIFPLRMIWGAWLLTVIGGGATVLMSTVFSMLSDITSPADRARIFLQLGVAVLAAQAIATPLAAFLMNRFGTSVPIALGYCIGLSPGFLAVFVTETLPNRKLLDEAALDSPMTTIPPPVSWSAKICSQIMFIYDSMQFLVENPVVVTLVTTFFINSIGTSSINVAIQYASKRFSISISDAGILIGIRAAVTIVYFLVLLPFMGKLLESRLGLKRSFRDMWLARITVLCLPFGFVLMTVSTEAALMAVGMVFTALGSGCGSLVRSIANGMVETAEVARLNGAISVVETFGNLVSGPLLAEVFSLGLRLGGAWMALPFLLATVLTAVTSLIVWIVKLPPSVDAEA